MVVRGKVQGVFYRAFTEGQASSFGLSGWVRNMPDGGVEAVFEGEKDDIEEVLKRCQIGPTGAKVTALDVKWGAFNEEFNYFSIRHY